MRVGRFQVSWGLPNQVRLAHGSLNLQRPDTNGCVRTQPATPFGAAKTLLSQQAEPRRRAGTLPSRRPSARNAPNRVSKSGRYFVDALWVSPFWALLVRFPPTHTRGCTHSDKGSRGLPEECRILEKRVQGKFERSPVRPASAGICVAFPPLPLKGARMATRDVYKPTSRCRDGLSTHPPRRVPAAGTICYLVYLLRTATANTVQYAHHLHPDSLLCDLCPRVQW